jgi:hypothetical protein
MDTQPIDAIDQHPESSRERRAGIGIWLASGATHVAILAVMAGIYATVMEDPLEAPPTAVGQLNDVRPPIPVNPPILPNPKTTEVTLNPVPEAPTMPNVADLPDVPDPGEDDAPTDLPPAVKGAPDALSSTALSNAGMLNTIGANSGDSGKTGSRYPGRGKPGGKKGHGVPMGAIKSVDAALRWFKRHQSTDGGWDATDYWRFCTEDGLKGEPGVDQDGDTDVAMTGYALLCFLGDGYDHTTASKYRDVVRKGLTWLVNHQQQDGLLGKRNYEHAIAAMALAQAYAMSPDPALRGPAQKATDIILARQNRDAAATDQAYARLGWDYVDGSDRNDASVTAWNVMALKSAYTAGLSTGDGLTGAKAWLNRAWKASNTAQPWCADPSRLDPYKDISRFAYVWRTSGGIEIADWDAAANRPASIDAHDMAPVGLVSSVFLGHGAGDAMVETLGNYVLKYHLPTAWPCNTYYLYYNTLGMFQLGGERWKTWSATVTPMLAGAQRRDEGCMNGSWDWEGTVFHGHDTGRVLSTAYACLSMQAFWIYERTMKVQ